MAWPPTDILRLEKSLPTNSCTARVQSDVGPVYLKAMGPHETPNALACELVGTQLAQWFGLSTFDFAVVDLDGIVEIKLINRHGVTVGMAQPGPAFVTRAEMGESWGGEVRQLNQLSNPEDISRLVVFDTWTLNCDRYRPARVGVDAKPRINRSNVFLSQEAPVGRLNLKAMDHGCCFTCGRELTNRVGRIESIRDELVFGCFPEFKGLLEREVVQDAADRLRDIDRGVVASMLARIPSEWDVKKEVQVPWIDLIVGRAAFIADTIEDRLFPQREFDF